MIRGHSLHLIFALQIWVSLELPEDRGRLFEEDLYV